MFPFFSKQSTDLWSDLLVEEYHYISCETNCSDFRVGLQRINKIIVWECKRWYPLFLCHCLTFVTGVAGFCQNAMSDSDTQRCHRAPPNPGPRGQMHRGTVGVILEVAQNTVSLLRVLCSSRKRSTQGLQKSLAGSLFQNWIEAIHIRVLNIWTLAWQSPTWGTTPGPGQFDSL